MHKYWIAFLLVLSAPAQTELDFLSGLTESRDLRSMLPQYLHRRALALLEERSRAISQIAGAKDAAARKDHIRSRILASLGGLPERTPLNARITGTIEREHYRIEKVLFESLPGFYVTGNLYVPKRGRAPYPAVLFPLGHETGGKANPTWQQFLGSVATKGYIAFAWDPLGQGERIQNYDEHTQQAKVVRSTTEHSMLGVQCLLTGDSVARYTIWDGIRALDYLLSRPEADPKRVAVTGNSGGGTHTAYLAALEDRIHVAAPSCYITSWRRLLESIGPQDAEQVLLPWLGDGLDHADFLHAFAPRPYLVLSAIRDFFSISGARESYDEARSVYARLGAEDKVAMVEADDGHGYSKPRRLAAYSWFARWLKDGVKDDEPEPEITLATEDELRVTKTGQVATSFKAESVFTLNLARYERLKRPQLDRADLRHVVRQLTGLDTPAGAVPHRTYGKIQRQGYSIEKLVYESEPGIQIPALLFTPAGASKSPVVLYAHGRGKAVDAQAGGEIEQLARAGLAVLAVDVRGTGETRTGDARQGSDFPRWFGDYSSAMTSLLIGETLVGLRVVDLWRGLDLLAMRPEVDASRISAVGKDAATVPMLHLAALDGRIGKLALEGGLVAWQSVVRSPIHSGVFENVVPKALAVYDLPDLVTSIAPRPVWIVDPVNAAGRPAKNEELRLGHHSPGNAVRVLRRRPETQVPPYLELLTGR